MIMNKERIPIVMKGRYPQSFLDELAKAMGIKWAKVKSECIPTEKIDIRPLALPIGKLYYVETKYE